MTKMLNIQAVRAWQSPEVWQDDCRSELLILLNFNEFDLSLSSHLIDSRPLELRVGKENRFLKRKADVLDVVLTLLGKVL